MRQSYATEQSCTTNGRRTLSLTAKLAWLAAAGALGTLARYSMAMFVDRQFPTAFPWAIFLVNMTGCLLFGVVYAMAEQRSELHDVRGIVLTGFMGAYTTYSTFAFQSAQFMEKSQWGLAAANIISQNVVGILCVFAGFAIGRALHV